MPLWILVTWMLVAATAADPFEENEAVNNSEPLGLNSDVIFTSDHDMINVVAYHIQDCYANINEKILFTEPVIFFSIVEKVDEITPRSLGQFIGHGPYGSRVFHRILENGLCTAVDDSDKQIAYIGAEDGIYRYNVIDGIASKFIPTKDTVTQIRKAHGQDDIYILTAPDRRIYKVSQDGIKKTLIDSIPCAVNFVIDYGNNIYYHCDDYKPYVLAQDSSLPVAFELGEPSHGLLAFPVDAPQESVRYLVDDGLVYELLPNGAHNVMEFENIPSNLTSVASDNCSHVFYAYNGNLLEEDLLEEILNFSQVNNE